VLLIFIAETAFGLLAISHCPRRIVFVLFTENGLRVNFFYFSLLGKASQIATFIERLCFWISVWTQRKK